MDNVTPRLRPFSQNMNDPSQNVLLGGVIFLVV